MTESNKAERVSALVIKRLTGELTALIGDPNATRRRAEELRAQVPADALALLDGVQAAPVSYRDGILIQLAYGVEVGAGFDHTHKGDGGRAVAGALGSFNAAQHIPAVRDAYQNIGKNSPNLTRGNVPAFDDLLRWMNSASREERLSLLNLSLARTAMTARPVRPMPPLARPELTFVKVAAFLDDLLAMPSGGAYEQFTVAAFLEAVIEEFDRGGTGGLWVKTKNINASDASSGATADVQVMRANRIEEAFEVSANDWREKVAQALDAAKNADLSRVNIVASVADLAGLGDLLAKSTTDVSVFDVKSLLRTLLGVLRKPGRETALRRLYELTERNQPEVERVNALVELLGCHSLTA
jgi:hypothetical protein